MGTEPNDSMIDTDVVDTDVVVVGGGSAGAVVTARLVEHGVDVVLVEAGPDYGPLDQGRWPAEILGAAMLATTHDWGYVSGPVPGRPPWTFERARIMGGCSAHNGAIAAVGHRDDYDAWALPLWRTDVLRPTFAAVLQRMRVRTYTAQEAGPFHARCLEAAVSAGWRVDASTYAGDLCDLDAGDGFGLESVNVVDGVRWNTAFAYLDPVRSRTGLQIMDETLVDRLEVAASHVVVHARRAGAPVRVRARTVVLAGGVYGTPAILQRSGIGDPQDLRTVGIAPTHDLPAVGRHLHDHPMVNAGRALGPAMREWLDDAARTGFVPEEQTLGKARSSQASDGVYDLHVFPVCASTQTQLTQGRALVEVACMTPRSRGRLQVVGPDPLAAPRIDHGYLTDTEGHDLAVLRDGLRLAESLLDQRALAEALVAEAPRALGDEALRRDVQHYYHPVGTARMGTDSLTSVCDERGRVHGLDRVVVADASLMPTIPRANTNIPAIVVAERIAAFLTDHEH
jgi:choline dehydrogenase